MATGTDTSLTPSLEAMLGPQLTAEQARAIYEQGPEATIFALLTLAKLIGQKQGSTASPTTPSGMTPVYGKPTSRKRRRKAGRKPGHPGCRRAAPVRIDLHQEHTRDACPHCHGPVSPCRSARSRLIEDIPEDITPVVTEHTIRRSWCAHCQQTVADALPG